MATFIKNNKEFDNYGTMVIEILADDAEAMTHCANAISSIDDKDIATIVSLLLEQTFVMDTAVIPYLEILDEVMIFDLPAGIPKVMPKDKAEAQLLTYTWSLMTRTK